MAITLDAFRNAGTAGSVLVGAGGDTLQQTTVGHRLKTFFNIGNARAQNAAVLTELKNALRADPQFFALHDRINELVGGIRTDRAIGAAQIQSVLTQLDSESTFEKQGYAYRAHVRLHVAMRGTPDCMRGNETQYAGRIEDYLVNNARPNGEAFATIDIASHTAEFDRQVAENFAFCGNDTDLKDVFTRSFSRIVRQPDAKIRPPAEVQNRLEQMRTALNVARANTETYGAGVVDDVREFLVTAAKAPTQETLRGMLGAARTALSTQLAEIDFADEEGLAAQLHDAFRNYAKESVRVRTLVAKDDPDVAMSSESLFAQTALRGLPADQREKLAAFLAGEKGLLLLQAYQCADADSPSRYISQAVFMLAQTVATQTGRPGLDFVLLSEDPKHPERLGLSRADLFDLSPTYLSKEDCAAESRLRTHLPLVNRHPGFTATPADTEYGLSVVDAMKAVFVPPLVQAPRTKVQKGELPAAHLEFVQEVLMSEIAAMPPAERPAVADLPAFLTGHPLVDLVKCKNPGDMELLDRNSKAVFRLRQMNREQRQAFIATLKILDDNPSPLFMRSFGQHVDELVDLHRQGGLSLPNVYAVLTGEGIPVERAEKPAGEIWDAYEFADTAQYEDWLNEGEITGAQFSSIVNLCNFEGLKAKVALQVARGEIPKPADDPFEVEIQHGITNTMDDVESALAMDLNRINSDYVNLADGTPAGIRTGGTFIITGEDGQELVNVNTKTCREDLSAKDRAAFETGQTSSVSRALRTAVQMLCGVDNRSQAKLVMTALGQASMLSMRTEPQAHGIGADEHSPAVWTVAKRPNGDVAVTVSQPEGCPLEFRWTYVFDAAGHQHLEGERVMRRAQ